MSGVLTTIAGRPVTMAFHGRQQGKSEAARRIAATMPPHVNVGRHPGDDSVEEAETDAIKRERRRLRVIANREEQTWWLARAAKIEAETRAALRRLDGFVLACAAVGVVVMIGLAVAR